MREFIKTRWIIGTTKDFNEPMPISKVLFAALCSFPWPWAFILMSLLIHLRNKKWCEFFPSFDEEKGCFVGLIQETSTGHVKAPVNMFIDSMQTTERRHMLWVQGWKAEKCLKVSRSTWLIFYHIVQVWHALRYKNLIWQLFNLRRMFEKAAWSLLIRVTATVWLDLTATYFCGT